MSAPTRQRPNSPGVSADELSYAGETRASLKAAREAAAKAAKHQRKAAAVISADEIQTKAREEAARKAALPPWYQRKRYGVPLFAAVLLAVAGGTLVMTKPEPPPPVVPYVAPTVAAPSIGQTVTDGRWAFTLHSVSLDGELIGETVGAERAHGTWVVAHVDVKNVAKVAGPLDVQRQYIVDTAGNKYTASVVPSLDGWDQAYITGIKAGETVAAPIAFDVPQGTQFSHLELHDAQFGKGGAKIPLR
ncbi:MAG: DUF4352 domain-containing protein [Dermatophilus congolensis]|nr:DUF4352 domain-containing protein [Dermatophilus congolensis]